jgi:hypothetical protein
MRYRCSCGNDDCYITVNKMGSGRNACEKCSSEQRRATNIERRGVKYPMQCPEVQAKYRATNVERRGVENPAQCPEVQARTKATNLERRGVEYPMQCHAVQEKSKATNLERRGVEHPMQCHVVQEKAKATNLVRRDVGNVSQCPEVQAKKVVTNLERRGVECPFQCPQVREKSKATNVEWRGVEHPMQCPEVFDRQQASAFSRKPYTFPNGKTVNVQGYEHYCLDDLLKEGINQDDLIAGFENIPAIWYVFDGRRHRYYTDAFIPSLNRIVETKSLYTYDRDSLRNDAKLSAAVQAGYQAELRIYDDKGELLRKITYGSSEIL